MTKYVLRSDIEHLDGSISKGIILNEYETYEEAKQSRKEYLKEYEHNIYYNIDIEMVENESEEENE